MSGSPLRPPQTSAEWARDTERRLRALENPQSLRIGPWVITAVDGKLIAAKPAQPALEVGQEPDPAIVADMSRGFVVDLESKVVEAVTGISGGDTSDLSDFLNGKWAVVSGNTTDVSDIVTNAGATGPADAGTRIATTKETIRDALVKIWEGLTGNTAAGDKSTSDVKTAHGTTRTNITTAQGTANTGVTNAATAQGAANNLTSRFDTRVVGSANLATDPGFENTLLHLGSAVRDTAQKLAGTYSARMTSVSPSSAQLPLFTDTTSAINCYALAGDVYYMEIWVYGKATNTQTTGGTNALALGVTCFNGVGGSTGTVYAQQMTASTSLNSVWTKMSGNVTLPANTASFYAFVNVTAAATAGEVYYFDRQVIREITVAQTGVTNAATAQSTANTGVTNAATAQGTANTAATNATSALGRGQNILDRFWEAWFGGSVSGKTESDFKTAAQAMGNTATSAQSTADTARNEPIIPHRVPLIPVANISDASINQVLMATFETAASVTASASDWTWDGTNTQTGSGGSIKSMGFNKTYRSNRIDVALGNRLDVGAWTKYSSVTATAGQNAIRLSVVKFTSSDSVIGTTMVAGISSPSGTLTWTELAATYTVTDATCAYIKLELAVTSAMSAGTVWFDNWSAVKNNTLAETVAEVAAINTGIGTAQGTTETLQQFFNTPRQLDPWIGTLGDDVAFANTLIDGTTAPTLGQIVLIPVRVSQDRTYDAIKFGIAATTMTNCYVGLYEIDEATGSGTLVMDLGDCKAQLSTTLNLQTVSMGTTISVQRGELYYIAVLQVGGSAAALHRWSAATNFTTGQFPRFLGMVHATGSQTSFPSSFTTANVNSGTKFWGALGTAVSPNAPGQAFYSDGFNRTNAASLGSSWNPRYMNTNDLAVDTNQAVYPATGGGLNTYVSRLATAEQEVGARFGWSTGASNNTYACLLLRGNGAGKFVYLYLKLQSLSGTATIYTVTNGLYSTVGSALSSATSRATASWSGGSDLYRDGYRYANFKVTCAAKVYTAYLNGTQIVQWDDTATSYFAYSGSNTEVGAGLARTSGSSYVRMDDWYAKDLA